MDNVNLQWDIGDEIPHGLEFGPNVQPERDVEPDSASELEGVDTAPTSSVLYDLDAAAIPGWHGLEVASVSEIQSASAPSDVESSISVTAESAEDKYLDAYGLEAASVSEIQSASAPSDVNSSTSVTAESAEDEHLDVYGLEEASFSEIQSASAPSDVESSISVTAESAEDEHLDVYGLEEASFSEIQSASAPSDVDSSISVTAESGEDKQDEVVIKIVDPGKVPMKKRRGRKPKTEGGSSTRYQKKKKLYEVDQPFEDEDKERKRQNAIKAKEHRERMKQDNTALRKKIQELQTENAALHLGKETLEKKVAELEEQLVKTKKTLKSLSSVVQTKPS